MWAGNSTDETVHGHAGKSTLLKLMCGDLYPTRGDIKRHSHLVIGRYHQHSVDVLDDKMEGLICHMFCRCCTFCLSGLQRAGLVIYAKSKLLIGIEGHCAPPASNIHS